MIRDSYKMKYNLFFFFCLDDADMKTNSNIEKLKGTLKKNENN